MKKRFTYLAFIFLIVFSCKTIEIEDKKSYKKINKKNIIIQLGRCHRGDIYLSKKNKKELNGRFRIKQSSVYGSGYTLTYTNFKNGFLNGKHLTYSKNTILLKRENTKSNYVNGLKSGNYENFKNFENTLFLTTVNFTNGKKNGIETKFINDSLSSKSIFIDNIKQGIEYHFNLENKLDTLDIINYKFEKKHYKPYINEFNLDKDLIHDYNNSDYKGIITLEGLLPDSEYNGFFLTINPPFYNENDKNCKNEMFLIKIGNVKFLAFNRSIFYSFHKLEK